MRFDLLTYVIVLWTQYSLEWFEIRLPCAALRSVFRRLALGSSLLIKLIGQYRCGVEPTSLRAGQ